MAVAAKGSIPVFKWMDEEADTENKYDLPTTCLGYAALGGRNADGTLTKILFIVGDGAPSTDYNNAPVNSFYLDKTNHVLYLKDDTGANWATISSTT